MKPVSRSPKPIFLNRLGFTLFELSLAILILAVAIVPMVKAFAPALMATVQGEEQAVLMRKACSTMNRLIDLDYSTLRANQGSPANPVVLFGSAAEAAKENLVYNGETHVPVIAVVDASGGTGSLLELRVNLKSVDLRTLRASR